MKSVVTARNVNEDSSSWILNKRKQIKRFQSVHCHIIYVNGNFEKMHRLVSQENNFVVIWLRNWIVWIVRWNVLDMSICDTKTHVFGLISTQAILQNAFEFSAHKTPQTKCFATILLRKRPCCFDLLHTSMLTETWLVVPRCLVYGHNLCFVQRKPSITCPWAKSCPCRKSASRSWLHSSNTNR